MRSQKSREEPYNIIRRYRVVTLKKMVDYEETVADNGAVKALIVRHQEAAHRSPTPVVRMGPPNKKVLQLNYIVARPY